VLRYWTALLIWAYQKPLERKVVAALTVLVIYGLVCTEIVAVLSGHLAAWRMLPTWFLQTILVSLFAGGFHYSKLGKWRERPPNNAIQTDTGYRPRR